MGTAYFYFCATLPMLDLEKEVPFSQKEFLDDSRRLLSDQDALFIQELLLDDIVEITSSDESYQKLFLANRNFKNALTAFRAERAGKEPQDFLRGDCSGSAYLNEIFHSAGKETNLLTGQKMIDKAYWQHLDDSVMGQYSNIEFLGAYGLKLGVLDRYRDVASTRGREMYDELMKVDVFQEKSA